MSRGGCGCERCRGTGRYSAGDFRFRPPEPATSTGALTREHLDYCCYLGQTTPETLIYARDSSGRVYQEFHNEHAQPPGLMSYCVFDPAAQSPTSWNSGRGYWLAVLAPRVVSRRDALSAFPEIQLLRWAMAERRTRLSACSSALRE